MTFPASRCQEAVARIPVGWSDPRAGMGEAEGLDEDCGCPRLSPELLTLSSETMGL